MGPVAASSVWYAQSRLAYSTLGFHIWAQGVDEMHTVLSRVMEKSVAYSMAALRRVLEEREERPRSITSFCGQTEAAT